MNKSYNVTQNVSNPQQGVNIGYSVHCNVVSTIYKFEHFCRSRDYDKQYKFCTCFNTFKTAPCNHAILDLNKVTHVQVQCTVKNNTKSL